MTSRDTSPEARQVQLEAQRRIGPAGRVEMAFRMSEEARRISIAGIRNRDPRLSEDAARAVLLRKLLGDELFEAAFPSGS